MKKSELKQLVKEELKILLEEKYRTDIGGVGEDVWSTNAKTFNTEEEAKKWLDNLSGRWFGYDLSRVVLTSTPKRQKINLKKDKIYQNFRK